MENTAGVSSQLSLPPVGRWGYAGSRKSEIRVLIIQNTDGVSLQSSLPPYGQWGFAESRVP